MILPAASCAARSDAVPLVPPGVMPPAGALDGGVKVLLLGPPGDGA